MLGTMHGVPKPYNPITSATVDYMASHDEHGVSMVYAIIRFA